MREWFSLYAALVAPTAVDAQALAGAQGERSGITAVARHVFDDATMPGKEFRVLHTTCEPGGVHAHRNASDTEKLVFLEFVIVDKGQRSTVPMR